MTANTMLLNRIAILFGGRIAEEVFMNQMTTGRPTTSSVPQVARDMVCATACPTRWVRWCMPKTRVKCSWAAQSRAQTNVSEETMRKVDAEIRRIIDEQYALARKLIEDNRDKIGSDDCSAPHQVETIDADQIEDIGRREPREPKATSLPIKERMARRCASPPKTAQTEPAPEGDTADIVYSARAA